MSEQTVQWFGPSWDAPINDPDHEVEVPVGQECIVCTRPVEVADRGVRVPHAGRDRQWSTFHLQCFLRMAGLHVPIEAHADYTMADLAQEVPEGQTRRLRASDGSAWEVTNNGFLPWS